MSASENSTIRIMLMGAREAMAGLAGTAGAVEEVGAAQKAQGLAALTASERTWLHNQALFTMRRYAYAGTLALTALVAETLRWGYSFNQTMASSRAALKPIIGDSADLNSELTTLFNFTKYTPFQFKDITVAFRQMYVAFQPLGISIGDTNQTLFGLVNALSEAGRTTPGALNRVAVALQHMAFMGHLTGQTVLQLARDGIPIFNVLQKELGLTGEELHKVGNLGIPTATVLKAISDYLTTNPIFSGAARRQAMTFSGMLTTLKDNVSQLMGALTLGQYSRGPGFIARLNATFDQIGNKIQQNAAAGKGMSITWDQATKILARSYPWITQVVRILEALWLTVRAVWSVFSRQFVPGLRMAAYVLAPLYIMLLAADHIILLFSGHTRILAYVFTFLIARWLIMRELAFILALRLKILAFWEGVMIARTELLTAWQARLTLAEITAMNATVKLTLAQKVLFVTMGRVAIMFQAMRLLAAEMAAAYVLAGGGISGVTAALAVLRVGILTFLASVPIVGWILLAVSALIILYFKWQWFHNLVNRSITWIISHWRYVVLALGVALGPIGLLTIAVVKLIGYFRTLVRWAREAGKWIGNAWHHVPGHGLVSGAAHLIGLAAGGTVTRAGAFLVGESGPELVSLPSGASVHPSGTPGTAIRTQPSGGFQWPDLYVKVDSYLDKKKVGEGIAKIRLDAAARA